VGSGSRTSLPVQFVLQNQDLDKLRNIIPKFLDEAKKDKTFSNVDVNLKFNRPELQITVDRMKIKDLGLSTQDGVSAAALSWRKTRVFYPEWVSVPGYRTV
jgi:HAE1 family hydrophobic/amphiphilic exporter-1/multidrug efflux pump